MARQEIPSTFGDGLMMDLNPINTPKSVLTDCLNGTYITYNGNEFVLQNDMGNYKLKNCKLPTNFIPVGVKGYGDILYIVSYNPITKETEIGSYPAPQSIFTTGDSEALLASEDDLAPFVIKENEDGKTEIAYPEIIKTNKKPIFIFSGGTDEEIYKLNPGDEFRFSGELTPPAFIYQHLNFYIIDEDNKLYDIDDTQIYHEDGTLVSLDLRKVFWETPGWLAAQYDLYVPDKFNLNLKSLNVPEFLTAQSDEASSQTEDTPLDELEPDKKHFKVSMDLSSQTIITDKLFQTELDKHFGNIKDNLNTNMFWEKNPANVYDHLYIRYLIKRNIDSPDVGEDDYGTFKGIVVSLDDTHTQDYTNGVIEGEYVYYDIPVWKHNYQDDIITTYNNVRPIWFCKNPDKKEDGSEDLDIANYHGVVELTAYPIIKYNGLTLKYTQFSTTQRFPLNTLKNSSDITIADSIYKWSVDDDSCTISFNINGPFINASGITGRYEIYRINLFKNPPGSEEKPWDPNTAISSLDDPQSYSKWTGFSKTINARIEGVWEKPEGQDKEQFVERIIGAGINSGDTNDFVNKKEVLMCRGTLSNLVLYGQNTINIDWSSSNEYKLTGYQNWYTNPDHTEEDGNDNWFLEDTSYVGHENQTKTINFSKEGGIYMFRVILEQNGSQLAETKQILIPSEVFNEWFGSIDDYNNITGTQWVQNWWNYNNISSLLINSINVDFSKNQSGEQSELLDGWLLYKWNSDSTNYKPLTRTQLIDDNLITDSSSIQLTEIQLIEILYNYKFPNNTRLINKGLSDQTFEWTESTAISSDTLLLQIDYNKFEKYISNNISVLLNSLNGNLWNTKKVLSFILKQKSIDLGINILYKDSNNINISFNNIVNNSILMTINSKSGNEYSDWIFPFAQSLRNLDYGITLGTADVTSGSYRGRKVWTRVNKKYWDGRSESPITHHNWGQDRKGTDDSTNACSNDFYQNLTMDNICIYYPICFSPNGSYGGNYYQIYTGRTSDLGGGLDTYLATDNNKDQWKPMFAMQALNSTNTRMVVVDLESFDNLTNLLTVLAGLGFRNKLSNTIDYKFPTCNLQNSLLSEQTYQITKADANTRLNYLFTDDFYLMKDNELDINILSNLLIFTDSIQKERTQYNIDLASSIILNLQYNLNKKYNDFIIALNNFLDTDDYTDWLTNFEKDLICEFFKDAKELEKYIGSEKITIQKNSGTTEIYAEDICKATIELPTVREDYLIGLFNTTRDNDSYSVNNVYFNNSKDLEIRTCRCSSESGGDFILNTGIISYCWYQKMS